MNVLSLFDGMSCGQIALNGIGIKPAKYYASELDKYAITVTQANYPDTIQLGDVTKWREWDIDWSSIDFVSAGFPCQSWSLAGKQLGDKDERGMLFWVTLDIISFVLQRNPQAKFMLENVKMKKEFEDYITLHTENALGVVHKTLINSALLSAQNRNRYYWTNFAVSQPEDKGVLLADIIEDGGVDRDKAHCVDVNYFKGGNLKAYFEKNGRQVVFAKKSQTILATIYKENAKSMIKRNKKGLLVADENLITYRKLSPLECERLQTVPDNYTAAIEKCIYSLYNCKETDKKEDLQLCDVKLMVAKGKQGQKSMVTCALCTTNDLLDMDLLNYQKLISVKTKSVNIVIEKLEKKEAELEGCVVDITKTGLDMETLYMQIKSSLNLGQEATKNALVVKTSTGKLLRIISAESCQEMRLFTILIAIKLITQLRICMYVKDRANIHYCIGSLKESQGNLLSVALSSLRMETTEQTVSNTQRYKMLGNGFTVDVIAHILKGAFYEY